jgi:uncharacterized protein (DUF1697 family)
MMNVYDQVEKLLSKSDDTPAWADAILFELREIKRLLEQRESRTTSSKKQNKSDYFAFVKKLRQELRADILNDIYPEIHYQGKELGINFKGHIYDKATTQELPAHEAFGVYRFLYDNRNKLDKYLKK